MPSGAITRAISRSAASRNGALSTMILSTVPSANGIASLGLRYIEEWVVLGPYQASLPHSD